MHSLVYPLPSVLSGVLSNRWSRGHGEVEEVTEITREMKEPHKQPWENVKNFVQTRCSSVPCPPPLG